MLKIWHGPELEGFSLGVDTLFLAADVIVDTQFIIDLLNKYGLTRIYLGAGRTDFNGLLDFDKFINYCKDNSIEVVAEVNIYSCNQHIQKLINEEYVCIIYTVRILDNLNCIHRTNALFKYDDYNKSVLVINPDHTYITDLDSLNGMLYDCDEIIYEA